jgi:hypothetical protein
LIIAHSVSAPIDKPSLVCVPMIIIVPSISLNLLSWRHSPTYTCLRWQSSTVLGRYDGLFDTLLYRHCHFDSGVSQDHPFDRPSILRHVHLHRQRWTCLDHVCAHEKTHQRRHLHCSNS